MLPGSSRPAATHVAFRKPRLAAAGSFSSLSSLRLGVDSAYASSSDLASLVQSKSLVRPLGPPPRSHVQALPSELLLMIFDTLPVPALLKLRQVSHQVQEIANLLLRHRLSRTLADAQRALDALTETYEAERVAQQPLLAHFRQFLERANQTELTEATWFSAPPAELQTVCECLCILRGRRRASPTGATTAASTATATAAASEPGRTTMSWGFIRKTMARYDFRTWFSGLPTAVERIPLAHLKRVEQIIMHDGSITYERLREVSRAGYKLLITIAACLQYGMVHHQLKDRQQAIAKLSSQVTCTARFLTYVS
ncbi:hypothetical protein CXG81DRAFT_13169 [Caulochytrium protostelioides]|uniref:F-box domain-containing protein n=1 Tax=Caulochytrium protostelioides TaxID=1555241 RepID=A0A4P9WVY5_9FUNG|nr:hypothetical protein CAUPRSCDRAFT_7814 [Caulochytrium protostelioides]RKP00491.1 hypothetical protein CXG81DRAFT_13169 [Caulochytrium protostelioides]|eukprot:RKP00491.1 hypothetical protein CXG81DRAFT_13169 [Caulochytrium protostelioides]